jgi:hypothetical protein
VRGVEPVSTPVFAPRTVVGHSLDRDNGQGQTFTLASLKGTAMSLTKRMPLIAIDGNRDGTLVFFNHDGHVEREGGDTSCTACHHLNMPLDSSTSCYQCHRDMYEPTSLFNHATHVHEHGGNEGCAECHNDYSAVKNLETATGCGECHDCPASPNPIVAAPGRTWRDAPGYVDAMHGLCITCHKQKIELSPERYPAALERCDNCHDADLALELTSMTPARDLGRLVVSDE